MGENSCYTKTMAHININFYSKSLVRPVDFKIYIPNDPRPEVQKNEYSDRPMKTLILLHGYTGDAYNWVREDLAQKYNFAIVMISGENSFYLNGLCTGHKYETFLAEEIIDYLRKTFNLAQCPEDTYLMGFSMGGFGTLHTGLKYPQTFGKLAALSSALIVGQLKDMPEDLDNGIANYAYYRECFGDLKTAAERDCNPEVLVKQLKKDNKKFPVIYMACGTEDFLIEPNRQFHKFLEENNVSHTYCESKGEHNQIFWDEYSAKFVEEMFK